MFRFIKMILIWNIVLLLTSCVSWWSSPSEEKTQDVAVSSPGAQPSDEKGMVTATPTADGSSSEKIQPTGDGDSKNIEKNISDQLGLSQARITERMAEIESELKSQREKIKLLERGLLTGIPPSDLKDAESREAEARSKAKNESLEELAADERDLLKSELTAPVLDPELVAQTNFSREASDGKSDHQTFDSAIAKAQKEFQSGDFQRSLNNFAEISRTYGEKSSGGVVRFWLGKCYSGLKDHASAKGEFEAYLAMSPMGPNAADARLELARTLSKMGLKERARGEFKKVMKDFEGQEPAELAAFELSALQGAL